LRGTEAVLLDFDGTLIDSNHAHAVAWRDYLEKETGLDLPASRLGMMIGMGGDKILTELFGDRFSPKQMKKMGEARDELYLKEQWSRVQPVPGAYQFVQNLYSRGYKVVLATSMSNELLETAYKLFPIQPFILGATTADMAEESKPSPDIFSAAMKKYALAPARTAVVGDSPYDIAAAKEALCRSTIAVRTGDFPDAVLATAAAIYDSVSQLDREFDSSPLAK